jgi:SAM-dependent methyltransferase
MTLRLNATACRTLLEKLGPSLGLWRAAEIAVLRAQPVERPMLEVGCGDGLVSSLVWERIEMACEPDTQAVDRARALHIYDRLEPVPVEEADVAPQSFATVVSNSVLEHVPRLNRLLLAVRRLLRPWGRLIFTAPTEAFSGWLLAPVQRYAAWRNRCYNHLNLWPAARWREQLRAAGFEVEEVRPYLRRPAVAAWDAMELLQQVYIGRQRLFGMLWRRLPAGALNCFARAMARMDFSAPEPGGGRLIVARRT